VAHPVLGEWGYVPPDVVAWQHYYDYGHFEYFEYLYFGYLGYLGCPSLRLYHHLHLVDSPH
jgi:hypothetical protein